MGGTIEGRIKGGRAAAKKVKEKHLSGHGEIVSRESHKFKIVCCKCKDRYLT